MRDMNVDVLVIYDDEFCDLLDIAFPGFACVASRDEFVRAQCKRLVHQMRDLAEVRIAAAASGAMRWPWSQEYGLRDGRFRDV